MDFNCTGRLLLKNDQNSTYINLFTVILLSGQPYRTLQCITRTFFTQMVLCIIWSALYSGTPNFELFSRSLKVEKTSYNC